MKIINYALPLALLLSTGNVMAADLDGEKLYNGKSCASCHGVAGNEPIMDAYPKLGGQSATYLMTKLKSYKAGDIKGGMSAVMTPMASMLSDEEAEAVANYLSGVKCEPES